MWRFLRPSNWDFKILSQPWRPCCGQLEAQKGYFWCFPNILTSLRSCWHTFGALGAFGPFLGPFLAVEDALSRISTLELKVSPRCWERTCQTVQENKKNSNWSYLHKFNAKDPRQQHTNLRKMLADIISDITCICATEKKKNKFAKELKDSLYFNTKKDPIKCFSNRACVKIHRGRAK